MAAFVRWVFAVRKLVGTVGKQSRMMIWACFHVPAWSAFWYSTTADMYKGNTFYYFWLRTAAAIWRTGPPFQSWCILNDQVSTHLPASFVVKKRSFLLTPEFILSDRVVSVIPPLQSMWWHLHFLSDQTVKKDFFILQRILFFSFSHSAQQILSILGHVVQQFGGLDKSLQQTG